MVIFWAMLLTIATAEDRIVCPRIQSTDQSLFLESSDEKSDFWEVSGLGFSPTQIGPSGKPIFYAINDGGGGRRFGIFDSGTGNRLLSLRLPRSAPLNADYEGLTVGPCGVTQGDCIYIADVGDNAARGSNGNESGHDRQGYPIYKIQEPNLDDFQDNDIIDESMVMILWFNYFDDSSPTRFADCEAVFLDSVGWGDGAEVGDFYLVTKWDPSSTLNRLFKIPAQAWLQAANDPDFVYSAQAVGNYDNGNDSNAIMGRMWTRAEMTFDGTLIALGDYYDQYLFLRCQGMSVAEALAVEGTLYCLTWPIGYWEGSQFEAISWTPDKSATLEVSECGWGTSCNPDPPMVFTYMDYTYNPDTSIACPLESDTDTNTSPTPPTPTDNGTVPTTSASTVPFWNSALNLLGFVVGAGFVLR